jgi:putative membrane protein
MSRPDDAPPELGPLDPRDYSRRTLLANERTYLAWWRTGLTSLTAGLAAAQVVPRLDESVDHTAYTILGAALAVLGTLCIGYGHVRRIAVDRAVRRGEFADLDNPLATIITVAGVLVGVGLIVLIVSGG